MNLPIPATPCNRASLTEKVCHWCSARKRRGAGVPHVVRFCGGACRLSLPRPRRVAALLQQIIEVDPLACPTCPGAVRFVMVRNPSGIAGLRIGLQFN